MATFAEDVDDDLRSILAAEFNTTANITANNVNLPAVDGIFDSTFLDIDEDGAPIQTTQPQFGCFVEDIDAAIGEEISEDNTDSIIIEGVKYRVDHVERGGVGLGRIILKLFKGKNEFKQAP